MQQRDGCFRIRHSTPPAPEPQATQLEMVLYWIKQAALFSLMLLAIYKLVSVF